MNLIMFDDTGNDSFTKILLHMDGSDFGSTFTDTAAGATGTHTWTRSATSVATRTVAAQLGSTGYYMLSGAGGYISTPDHADFTLGSSDLTIDLWLNRQGDTGNRGLFGQHSGGLSDNSTIGLLDSSGIVTWTVGNGSVSTVTSINGSSYHHLELSRVGTSLLAFVDGALDATGSISGSVTDSTQNWFIGMSGLFTSGGTWSNYLGYLDEFRLSVGIARHTANFSVPTVAYGPN